jgi:hypothetical protein
MPVPIAETASGIDLSPRFVSSTAIVGSPSAATETIIAQISVVTDQVLRSGVLLRGFAAFTVGTSGTATTLRLRQTNVSGTVIATTGALTGGVAAGNLVADTILGVDTSPAATGQVYVLTLQVTGGAAASTVSAVELDATLV